MTETESSAIHDKVDVEGTGDRENDGDSEDADEEESQKPLTPHSQVIKKQRLASKLLKKRLKLDHLEPVGQIFLPEDSSWRLLNESLIASDNERVLLDYRLHFCDKEHVNFRGRDVDDNPVFVSVVIECGDVGLIVRTIDGTWSDRIRMDTGIDKMDQENVLKLAKQVMPQTLEVAELAQVDHSNQQNLLLEYDDNHSKLIGRTKYSFGVLYQKSGQSTEGEIFGNIEHSNKFSEFVKLLGEPRPFEPDESDHMKQDIVRAYVIKETEDLFLKFYVLTFMPHSRTDNQQCFRKARIGNCVVSVVFQENGATFCPDIITSQFLHVYVVVQPVTSKEGDKYRVSVVTKKDVPDFGPKMNSIETFNSDSIQTFLQKLIGAEQASYRTGKLAFLRQRYRHSGLSTLEQKLDKVEQESEVDNSKWRVCTLL